MASDVMNIVTFFWGGGDALGTQTNKKVLECCGVVLYAYLTCGVCVCIVCDTPIRIAHLVSRTS